MGSEEKRRAREREREEADLAALADGSLAPERRREVEARVAASPRLQQLLLEQRAALAAIRARDEHAPQRLRDALERPPRSRRRSRYRVAVPLGAAAAAVVAAAVLVALPDPESDAPTLTQVAALATRAPTSGGRAEAWGIEYPDLTREYRWRTAGSRADRLHDRTAQTVFYANDGRRIAYTIVSTGSVRVPEDTRIWRRKGRPWYVFEDGGRTVVAWERSGHMCVVSASGLRSRTLVDMITG